MIHLDASSVVGAWTVTIERSAVATPSPTIRGSSLMTSFSQRLISTASFAAMQIFCRLDVSDRTDNDSIG